MPKSIHPSEIPGIAPDAVELLEATGYDNVLLLPDVDPVVLYQEVLHANATLQLADEDVSYEEVQRWFQEAAAISGRELHPPSSEPGAGEPQPTRPEGEFTRFSAQSEAVSEPSDGDDAGDPAVDYEQSPEVQSMLAGSPHALPLPARVLMENKVSVSQIPAGILLNHFTGDLEVRVSHSNPRIPSPGGGGVSSTVVNGIEGPDLDVSRMRVPGEAAGAYRPRSYVEGEDNPHSLIRAPRSSTNEGRDPNSRWFIRGVLHTNPVGIYLGALSTFLSVFLVPAAVVATVLLILSTEMPERFEWVPAGLLWIPAALGVVGLVYLICGTSGRCRVCNQKLFVYRSHHKNARAHRLPGLGYVLPLCLHLMIFRWFRCTHCGTPIRVKK